MRQFPLALLHIHGMIMHGMQGRGCWRGHPGCCRTRLGMSNLLRNHISHAIRRGPHAFADLRMTGQSTCQPHINIIIFISLDPSRRAHVILAHHRTCFKRGVDFIARAIQKACIDEHQPMLGRRNTSSQIHTGAPLFIHNADFDRIARQAEQILYPRKKIIGEAHFIRPVHFWFHNIDRALARIAQA